MEPMASPFHHFLHMAVFVAKDADGVLKPREALELQSAAAVLAREAGVDVDAAIDAVETVAQETVPDAAQRFVEHARLLATWFAEHEDVLRSLYHGLLQVASADREVSAPERLALDEVRRIWRL